MYGQKYLYREDIALRSWRDIPHAVYRKNQLKARPIGEALFELLLLCDGKHDVPESDLLSFLLQEGVIHPAAEDETLSTWQEYRHCDNFCFPAVQLSLTGKCNCNCLHCFNAVDNAPLMSEWTWEELLPFLDECQFCGINGFSIFGGEPMLHPRFMDVLRAIYDRGMYVFTINTNGMLLTQDKLNEMRSFGCVPLMRISFDGIGWHDWMRNRKGAEQKTLDVIRLCADNGFPVCVHANIHRNNAGSFRETMHLLADMGVDRLRILRTTESPRWKQNAPDATLTIDEYYDTALALVSDYAGSGEMKMDLQIWQVIEMEAKKRTYRITPVHCADGEYSGKIPLCRRNRVMLSIGADGNMYPCSALTGTMDAMGIFMGNVKKEGLQSILQSGPLLSYVCTPVEEVAKAGSKCGSCSFFPYCTGGCRALSLGMTGDFFGHDPFKCAFFEDGYYRKFVKALKEWENLTPVSILDDEIDEG